MSPLDPIGVDSYFVKQCPEEKVTQAVRIINSLRIAIRACADAELILHEGDPIRAILFKARIGINDSQYRIAAGGFLPVGMGLEGPINPTPNNP